MATRVHPPVWQYLPPLSPCTSQNDGYKSPPTCMTVSTPTESMYATEWWLQESTHLYDSIHPHRVHVRHRMMATRVHPPVWQYLTPLSPCSPQNDGYKSPPTCTTVSTPTESMYATEWWLHESTYLYDSIYPHWVRVRHRMMATRVHPPIWQYLPPLSPCKPQNDGYKSPPTCTTVSTPTESMFATEWWLQESIHLYDSIHPHWVHVRHRMIATRVHPPIWQYLPPLSPCKPQNDGYKSPPTCTTVSTPTESMYATEWWLQESTLLYGSIYPHWVHVSHRMMATRVHPPVWQYLPPLSPCKPQNDGYKSPPSCMAVSTPTESMYATEWWLHGSTHLYDSIHPHWVHVRHRMMATRVHPPVWQYLPPLSPCTPQNDGYKSPPTCVTVSTPTESM